MMTIKNGYYRHYKGKMYKVWGMAKHSETLEELVVYEPQYETEEKIFWVRPIANFAEKVNVDGKNVNRFTYIGDTL